MQNDMQRDDQDPHEAGLFASAASLARNLFGLIVSRLELAALELEEARDQLLKLVLVGAIGVVAAWFAVAFWSVLIVMLAWPTMGWTILALMALAFTLGAWLLFARLRNLLRENKLSLPATMAELRNDRDALL